LANFSSRPARTELQSARLLGSYDASFGVSTFAQCTKAALVIATEPA
jgi:hypothetical protein